MKRLILFVLTAILIVLFTTMAEAKNGPHSGPTFVVDTDVCAACHRTHTGTTAPLLGNDSVSIYSFCTFCHNGNGSQTNVVVGRFEGTLRPQSTQYNGYDSISDGEPGMGLNAGGYISAVPYTGRSSRSGTPVPLSGDDQRHNVTGLDTNSFIAWGGGYSGPGQEISGFTCISCHDPHGTENTDGTERYRILKGGVGLGLDSKVNGRLTGPIRSNEIAAFGRHDYTKDAHRTGLTNFCIACHTQYRTILGTVDQFGNEDQLGVYDAGDGRGLLQRHRHKIVNLINNIYKPISGLGPDVITNLNNRTKLPLEQTSGYNSDLYISNWISCLTCHQSHGTSATMQEAAKPLPASSSTLLRLSNRGVCQVCHNK